MSRDVVYIVIIAIPAYSSCGILTIPAVEIPQHLSLGRKCSMLGKMLAGAHRR